MILRRAANPEQINGACQKYTYEQAFIDAVPSRFSCSMSSLWCCYSMFDYLRSPLTGTKYVYII